MRRLGCILLATALWSGCDGGKDFRIAVTFPDQAARDRAVALRVGAVEPGEGAGCAALLDGSAEPGDAGFTIEDAVRFDLDQADLARPLEDVGPGQRLFFAEAYDAGDLRYLVGCASVKAGGRGPGSVTIGLVWLDACEPSNGGVETCDGLDNDCDGQTDDGDPVFLCPAVPRATATTCEGGQCVYLCDGDWLNANDEWSDGCECRLTRGGHEWCDGLDNDCDGVIDGPDCTACVDDADCDAPAWCLGGTCDAGTCQVAYLDDGTACDDGSVCSLNDACSDGVCLGDPLDCDDQDPCTDDACDAQLGCTREFNSATCDDGQACTASDVCDGAGACRGIPVTCDQPPGGECLDADTTRRYASDGNCSQQTGECVYEWFDEPCEFGCVAGACRSSQCQGQAVGSPCDDANACTGDDACDADEVCRGTLLDCDDQNPCTDDTCDSVAGCTSIPNANPCDDGDACTVADTCAVGICSGAIKDCSDGLDCTTDTCQAGGNCASEPSPGWCWIDGACWSHNQSPPGEVCRWCDSGLDPTGWTVAVGFACPDGQFCNGDETCDDQGACVSSGSPCQVECMGACDELADACGPDPIGTACDDGLGCTVDGCDGLGACLGAPDDGGCAPGQVCAPGCTGDVGGCVDLPVLTVDCADTPAPGPATCDVTTSGLADQLGCLSCRALIGGESIDSADFSLDGQPGSCDLDGWQMDDGPCPAPMFGFNCPVQTGGAGCCQQFSCPTTQGPEPGRVAFEFDPGDCGQEFWRPMKFFGLQGFADVQACYRLAHTYGGPDSLAQVHVDNGVENAGRDVLGCYEAGALPPDAWLRQCHMLPAAWLAIPQTRLLFMLGTRENQARWYLDDVDLTGWWPECPAAAGEVFSEDFTGCPLTLPPDYDGWTMQLGPNVVCRDEPCSQDLLRIRQGESAVLERVVDTGAVGSPVQLCWRLGGKNNGTVAFSAQVDFADGAGWQTAYDYLGPQAFDQDVCLEQCVDLSALSPLAAGNPMLEIRFDLFAQDEEVYLDDIRVIGAARCDADSAGVVRTSPLSQDAPEQYHLTVTASDARPAHVTVECTWAGRAGAATQEDTFQFLP